MSFSRRIKYFLVHTLILSNKEAQALIDSGAVEIDGLKTVENCILLPHSEIKVKGVIERPKKEYIYLKFHKPRGLESTLNISVPDNLSGFFKEYTDLAIAGRLDKQSEGLLLLSNDGKWVENMCNPKFEKEKEYEVTLDKAPDDLFLNAFSRGVTIGSYVTASCTCERIAANKIRVVLKEGKNRQIRRMCKALNYKVLKLKRQRIASVLLLDLPKGEKESFHFNCN